MSYPNQIFRPAPPPRRSITRIVAAHMRMFRFVSWASSGVNDELLQELRHQIDADFRDIQKNFTELAARPDLSAVEKADLNALRTELKQYQSTANDVLDVARTDPPMGTMMLGQSDDGFTSIDDDIRKVLSEITARSNTIVENTSAATGNETLSLAIGLLTCLAFSVAAIVFVSRSILKPITSITNAMQKVSTGDTEVTLNYRDRGDEIGQMIEAIQIFRHKELEIQTMQQSRHQAEQLQAHKRREEMSALAEDFDGSVKHIAGQLVDAAPAENCPPRPPI